MPTSVVQYRVLIASPGDVAPERDQIEATIHRWNGQLGETFGLTYLPVRWESDATPRQGQRAQDVINEDLVGKSDILIGVFWSRIGSNSGVHVSGSIEEVRLFQSAGKPHALLFKNADVPISHNPDQLKSLQDFKTGIHNNPEGEFRGLTQDFVSLIDLDNIVFRYLTTTSRRLKQEADSAKTFNPEPLPESGPDVSVTAAASTKSVISANDLNDVRDKVKEYLVNESH